MPLGRVEQREKNEKLRKTLNLNHGIIEKLEKNSLNISEAARRLLAEKLEEKDDLILTDHQKEKIREIVREEIEEVVEEKIC